MLTHTDFFSVANNTKWLELREAMLKLDDSPKFRSKCIKTKCISIWDGEWFYHFLDGGFEDIEWVELKGGQLFEPHVFKRIAEIQFAGEILNDILRIYGFVENGQAIEKLSVI